MASILSAVLLAAVFCATVFAQDTSPAEWERLKTLSHSNLDFSNSLCKVMSRHEGNLFFSPASIHTILALTSQGARGSTAQEMVEGLHLPADQQKTKDAFRIFMYSLESRRANVTTKLVNRIYTDARYPPTIEFYHTAEHDFHSVSEVVDFQHKHEEARANINSWVESNTEQKIKDLLPSGSVDGDTAMVLVNALYFKGAWDQVFPETRTWREPFQVSSDIIEEVPMMHLFVREKFAYIDSPKLKADMLEIPYVGNKVKMVIILPKEKNGLSDVERRLADIELSRCKCHRIYPDVNITLPKFKLEESIDLKETLTKMGMGTMFTTEADFSGLSSTPLKVSKVIHKAFIEVNEEGTEAAAASEIDALDRVAIIGSTRTITFKADHPFMFWLVKDETRPDGELERTLLFMGRFTQPN